MEKSWTYFAVGWLSTRSTMQFETKVCCGIWNVQKRDFGLRFLSLLK